MDFGLAGKIVVVTGASKGIGFACAEAFAREGARVAIVSRTQREPRRGARPVSAAGAQGRRRSPPTWCAPTTRRAIVADVETSTRSDRRARQLRRRGASLSARRAGPRAWHDAMDAKFFSYIHPTDVVVKRMAARGRGAIVNIIGSGGKVASPVHLPGGSANAALMLATVGLAAAYGPKGVRINGINPGGTLTGRVQEGLEAEARMTGMRAGGAARARSKRASRCGRLGTPEEVARVALFLASDRASYVTGAIVPMDGGANAVI